MMTKKFLNLNEIKILNYIYKFAYFTLMFLNKTLLIFSQKILTIQFEFRTKFVCVDNLIKPWLIEKFNKQSLNIAKFQSRKNIKKVRELTHDALVRALTSCLLFRMLLKWKLIKLIQNFIRLQSHLYLMTLFNFVYKYLRFFLNFWIIYN